MKPARTIGVRISYIARLQRTRFDHRARALGLTRAQWQTIAVIRWNEGSTQREVAERLEVGSVTAGRLIERLEFAGWIERRPDPEDRRAYRLYMSEKAQPMLEQLTALGADEEQRALRGLCEEERAVLARALDKIIENLCVPCEGEAAHECLPEAASQRA
jgi:MarR family transcriptional regulator, transcriptional regulator for hemolysin